VRRLGMLWCSGAQWPLCWWQAIGRGRPRSRRIAPRGICISRDWSSTSGRLNALTQRRRPVLQLLQLPLSAALYSGMSIQPYVDLARCAAEQSGRLQRERHVGASALRWRLVDCNPPQVFDELSRAGRQ